MLYSQMKGGSAEAREKLALSVWLLSLKCGHRYAGRRIATDELRSLCGLALAKCLEIRWNPEKGRLHTAIEWSVKAEVLHHRKLSRGTIEMAAKKDELAVARVRYESAMARLADDRDRKILRLQHDGHTNVAISEMIGLTKERVRQIGKQAGQVFTKALAIN